LKPGIRIFLIILDLIEMDGVEIFALIVIAHDCACAPFGAACAVFILQADEK
jgi:hypothetical protein